jgi:hypothetical protein
VVIDALRLPMRFGAHFFCLGVDLMKFLFVGDMLVSFNFLYCFVLLLIVLETESKYFHGEYKQQHTHPNYLLTINKHHLQKPY